MKKVLRKTFMLMSIFGLFSCSNNMENPENISKRKAQETQTELTRNDNTPWDKDVEVGSNVFHDDMSTSAEIFITASELEFPYATALGAAGILASVVDAVARGAWASTTCLLDSTSSTEDKYSKDPFSVNIEYPIFSNGLDIQYELDGVLACIGKGHNSVIRGFISSEEYRNNSDDSLKFARIAELTAAYIGKDITTTYSAYLDAIYRWKEQSFPSSYRDSINTLLSNLKNSRWEDFYVYAKGFSRDGRVSAYSVAVAIAYYSRCLWNTIAPMPGFAQECVVLDDLGYLTYQHRRETINSLCQQYDNHTTLLFPSYSHGFANAFYIYSDLTSIDLQNNSYISINDTLECYSIYFNNVKIALYPGEYKINSTIYPNLYYITID